MIAAKSKQANGRAKRKKTGGLCIAARWRVGVGVEDRGQSCILIHGLAFVSREALADSLGIFLRSTINSGTA